MLMMNNTELSCLSSHSIEFGNNWSEAFHVEITVLFPLCLPSHVQTLSNTPLRGLLLEQELEILDAHILRSA